MKGFLLSTLFATAFAADRVHQFQAESKYMCTKCVSIMDDFTSSVDKSINFDLCKDKYGIEFTDMCNKIEANAELLSSKLLKSKMIPDLSKSICEYINYCGDTSDTEYEFRDAINVKLINSINNDKSLTWKAGINERWKHATLKDVRKTLGTIVDDKYKHRLPYINKNEIKADLPTDFDSRSQWPNCANIIGHVRDQSSCGCCWAFGSTEAYNDRLCIATDGSFQQLLSVEDTCACCNFLQCDSNGCDGGQPTVAWEWFESTGVVSGGDYDDIGQNDTCDPFTLPPCAHHVNSTEYPPCPSTEYKTPTCSKDCSNTDYPKTWNEDLHEATKAYSLRSVDDIMDDLYTYGTVTAAFTVYEDFLNYKSGVYVHTSGEELGGHAIKIFGYGVEDGTDYWYCANSWNDSWGDDGFFKIKKGVNECGIESDVSAGLATSQ